MLYYTIMMDTNNTFCNVQENQVKMCTLPISALRKSNEYGIATLKVRGCAFFGA